MQSLTDSSYLCCLPFAHPLEISDFECKQGRNSYEMARKNIVYFKLPTSDFGVLETIFTVAGLLERNHRKFCLNFSINSLFRLFD